MTSTKKLMCCDNTCQSAMHTGILKNYSLLKIKSNISLLEKVYFVKTIYQYL